MKAILLAAAVLAASSASALAGEGGQDIFAQNLSGPLQTYAIGSAGAPARFAEVTPAYARLLPNNASVTGPETPNSLPAGATVHGYAHAKGS